MTSRSPTIWGVLNLTEDSFSDGGEYLEAASAISHARRLLREGAVVVDIGPASSHPDSQLVSPACEIERLAPLLDALSSDLDCVSIDSYHPQTQRYALSRGVGFLNDIAGFAEPEMYPELARASCRLVVMHSIQRSGMATREQSNPEEIIARIDAFFSERVRSLVSAGVARDRLILDPGMGFFLGDAPESSLRVLRELGSLRERHALPMLVSVSRKSFLGAITGRAVADRGSATLAAELAAARAGVDHIRTHDVRALRDALLVDRAVRLHCDPGDASGDPEGSA